MINQSESRMTTNDNSASEVGAVITAANVEKSGVLLVGGRSSDAAPLLNVSLSRARAKLVILADVDYFEQRAPGSLIQRLLSDARATGEYYRLGA